MSKFWGSVVIVFLVAVFLLFSGGISVNSNSETKIDFSDLETECRLEPARDSAVRLNEDNSLSFEGHFPESSVDADLGYDFRSGSEIVLNVKSSSGAENHSTFLNDCVASVKYLASTDPLEPGVYAVELRHNGRRIQRQILKVKE